MAASMYWGWRNKSCRLTLMRYENCSVRNRHSSRQKIGCMSRSRPRLCPPPCGNCEWSVLMSLNDLPVVWT